MYVALAHSRSLAHYTLPPSSQRHRLLGLHHAPPTMDLMEDLSNMTMFSSHRYLLLRPAKHQVEHVAYVSQTSGSLLPPNGCAACSPKTRPKIGPPIEILCAGSKPDLLPYLARNILGGSQLQSCSILEHHRRASYFFTSFLASFRSVRLAFSRSFHGIV